MRCPNLSCGRESDEPYWSDIFDEPLCEHCMAFLWDVPDHHDAHVWLWRAHARAQRRRRMGL